MEDLDLVQGVPLLRVLRKTRSAADDRLPEVNDIRRDTERSEVGYPISRDATAG